MSHSADTGKHDCAAIIGRKGLAWLLLLGTALAHGGELQLGRQTIAPGIVLLFEGAARDKIAPAGRHLEVESTNVHLEMLATWATDGTAPADALPGGLCGLSTHHRQAPARYASENFRNLFEVPVLFYALVLMVFHLGMVDIWFLGLAWGFAGFRVLHSVIHCSYNHVPHRFAAYGIACLALWIMLLRTVFLLATG